MSKDVVEALIQRIEDLEATINQLDRRVNNMFREGSVEEVDAARGLASVLAGGIVTNMSPWLTRAGSILDFVPVAPKERVIFISPSGDPGQGLILPGGFSSAFPQNHGAAGEAKRTIGDTNIFQSAGEARLDAGGMKIRVTPEGTFINC